MILLVLVESAPHESGREAEGCSEPAAKATKTYVAFLHQVQAKSLCLHYHRLLDTNQAWDWMIR